MKTLLKIAGWGLLGLVVVGGIFVGASFMFPKAFAPKIKTTELRAPSGTVYNIIERGPIKGIKSGARTLGVEYLADKADDIEAIKRGADELMGLVKPEVSAEGFDSLVVMAYRIVRQRGFVSYGESINTVFQRAAGVEWDIFSTPEAPAAAPTTASMRAELLAGYAKLNEAVRGKDPRAIWEMETDDYTDTLIDGEVMKKDADLTYMQKEFAGLTAVSAFDVKIISMDLSAGKVAVVVMSAFSGTVNEEARRDQTYYSQGYSRDVWRKTKDGWRIESSRDLGSKSFFFKS